MRNVYLMEHLSQDKVTRRETLIIHFRNTQAASGEPKASLHKQAFTTKLLATIY